MKRFIRQILIAAATLAAAFGVTAQTAYELSKHGHPDTGVLRIPEEGRGACAQCHDEHASRNGIPNGGPFNRALFTVDDETLCYECHSIESASHVYPGNVVWADSTHANAGKCVDCHDPHGDADATGVIPSMLRIREEAQCTGCHNGLAGKDIATQIAKLSRHPFERDQRHAATEGTSPAPEQYDDSSVTPRRHAECVDCHNPHVARADFVAPIAPQASERLYGVARVRVFNGLAGTIPTYEWRGAADLIDPREYEICFKCHSSWATLPAGKPDFALLTNPNNPSFHPIQAAGKNANIDPAAFVAGWAWDSTVYCSDCHGSDDPLVRGPHGSIHPHLLKQAQNDLCYSCHTVEVYGDPVAPTATQQASRFNLPSDRGHTYHAGEHAIACSVCHETHGSTTHPALIVTGKTPGLMTYTQTAAGGTCAPTCHASRSYSVNYAR